MDKTALNTYFAIDGHLYFEEGEGGLTKAVVHNAYAHCELYLQGAHIVSFKPHHEDERLWLSSTAQYKTGKAIRGGIPVCWPWFGPDPENRGRSQHGFARNTLWTLFGTSINEKGETVLKLGLQESKETLKTWSYAFKLEYIVTVGERLSLELITTNEDTKAFPLSSALHTYFAVDRIENVRIEGFDGKNYIDKLSSNERCKQEGDLRLNSEIDRIYEDGDAFCTLYDGRCTVRISKEGSKSTVIWNPWKEKAASMGDFEDEGYLHMVCIEAANTELEALTLKPGERYTLRQGIRVCG